MTGHGFPPLTQAEAGIILNQIFARQMSCDVAANQLTVQFVSDEKDIMNDPRLVLFMRAIMTFHKDTNANIGKVHANVSENNSVAKFCSFDCDELDMATLAKNVNFVGSEHFLKDRGV